MGHVRGGEVVMQGRVAELINRADGTQQPQAVGVVEEVRESPGKPALEG